MPSEDATFYTVSFNSNGGTDVSSQRVEEGKRATEPAPPEKDYCQFSGWLLNGAEYDFDTAVTKSITLTANWETTTASKSMYDIAHEIAQKMGVNIDSRSSLSKDYYMTNPNGYTGREILQAIAGAHGGNWIITSSGELYLVPLFRNSTTYTVGNDALSFKKNRKMDAISQVIVNNENGSFTSGGSRGTNALTVECPFVGNITAQKIADDVYRKIGGYAYQGFSAESARITPKAELGAWVSIGGIKTMLAKQEIIFSPGCFSNISAPGEQDVNHEFTYKSPEKAAQERQREQSNDDVEQLEDDVEQLEDDVDNLQDIVNIIKNIFGDTNITKEIFGDTTVQGDVNIFGDTNIFGDLAAQSLFAEYGDFVDLTVDRLSTSKRIKKYLAADTSDDNFVRIQDETIHFIAGICDAETDPIQALNPYGQPLYWKRSPYQNDGSVITGPNGYPFVMNEDRNFVQVYTTTDETEWPIYVYNYTEQVKASVSFELETNDSDGNPIYTPTITLGAGNAQGTNQARIRKGTDGLEIMYTPNTGSDIGVKMLNNGEMEIIGYDFIKKIPSEDDLPEDWASQNRIFVIESDDE